VKICVKVHFTHVAQAVGFGTDAAFVFSNDFLSKDLAATGNALLVFVIPSRRWGKMVDPQFVFDGAGFDG
jgi:hypothetical protein